MIRDVTIHFYEKGVDIMKKLISMALSVMLLFSLVGCGTGSDNVEMPDSSTVGGRFVTAFNSSDVTDANAMVDELIANVEMPYELVQMDVEPGYLNGFDEEIKGFNRGTVFAPMIGSIPFVGYVFETTDSEALIAELKNSANMRWNICTEADEMVSATKDKLVFFMMCTNDEQ